MSLSGEGWELLSRGCDELGLALDADQARLLGVFASALARSGRERGVTGFTSELDVIRELVVDSLGGLPELPGSGTVGDLGSGGGVPGFPLAIMRPDLRFVLVDTLQRKGRWLGEMVELLGLGERVEVRVARAEDLGRMEGVRERWQLVVSKALASMSVLVEYGMPLVEVGGRLLAYKGPALEEELQRADRALRELRAGEVRRRPYSVLGRDRVLCVVGKAGATPRLYPRRAGVPERKPL